MKNISRRGFLTGSAAFLAATQLPLRAFAQNSDILKLSASSRTLDINGRAATVYGLQGPSGQGLILNPDQHFRVDLTNDLDVETIIHWHGQIPPNEQDGVPDMPMPMLKPGEMRSYDFAPQQGTHWMHSHIPMQEMQLLAAPLIVRRKEDVTADRQEVVMFLHDMSFKTPQEVMEEIRAGHGDGDAGSDESGHGSMAPMQGMNHGAGGMGGMGDRGHMRDRGRMGGMGHMMGSMSGNMGHMGGNMGHMGQMMGMNMEMDLNDYNWDAYLANDRTLHDPEIVQVEKGGRVRLRIINASSATTFWIDTGVVTARLVATDGHDIHAVAGKRFGLSMGQRLDIELDLPEGTGAWPILALREGAREQTGIILATAGAEIAKIATDAAEDAPAFDIDLSQEMQLSAVNAIGEKQAQTRHHVVLGGSMEPYIWTINGAVWGEHKPLHVKHGERVELVFHNMSMMGHPMHLHGHTFQVVGINRRRINGARRDTVYIPPMTMVTVALDAGEAARWMLHCHHMPHLETGMMTEFIVNA